ncbi:MAG: hypothetical protein AAGC46_09740 [Solirubrobacteraceae bacterium]|nr:hypothetical protein [Patulibacter sp.]
MPDPLRDESTPPRGAAMNPIDAVIGAGRLYGQHLAVVLPAFAALQAVKAGILLALIAQFGEKGGGNLGWLTSSILLIAVDVAAARFVVDAHHGDVPRSPIAVIARIVPILPLAVGVGLVSSFVLSILAAPLHMGVSTQAGAFPAIALLTVWLDARRTKGDPAAEFGVAIDTTLSLTGPVIGTAVLLAAFQLFTVELIPALADSAVGRHAALARWVPVESAVSTFITPIAMMAIAGFYLQLRHPAEPAQPAAPATPWPQLPGAPPAV